MPYQVWHRFVFATRETKRKILRTALAGALVLFLPILAGAYTLVLRDGRHLEIPGTFVVTQSTLTYARAPGFNVTLQLYIIDIPATERINRQAPGSFLRLTEASASHQKVRTPPGRTITNVDLEPSRRARLQSETAYEKRRRELGLPTLEETRRRDQQDAEQRRDTLREETPLRERDEAYWRARAGELRTALTEINGQLGYLNARLVELSESRVLAPAVIGGFAAFPPFVSTGGPFATNGRIAPGLDRAPIHLAPTSGTVSGQLGFGAGHFRGIVALHSRVGRHGFGWGRNGFGSFARVPFGFGYPALLVPQSFAFDSSYERSALIEQLNRLLMTRAGLQARWRLLEEEARRDGAPPGWLRE